MSVIIGQKDHSTFHIFMDIAYVPCSWLDLSMGECFCICNAGIFLSISTTFMNLMESCNWRSLYEQLIIPKYGTTCLILE